MVKICTAGQGILSQQQHNKILEMVGLMKCNHSPENRSKFEK